MSCECPPTSPVRVFVISSVRNVPSLLRVLTISPTRPPPPPLRILGHLPCVFLLPALRILHHFLYMSSVVCSPNPLMTLLGWDGHGDRQHIEVAEVSFNAHGNPSRPYVVENGKTRDIVLAADKAGHISSCG
ncbi:hypothetical protein PoB_004699900 [Plakobranchus ocellatus]|uniref:Uncharacterized protein n=1 Tax=Plakobranchus ocellatus TaxID=259542 RepID=A0AAV4BK39_9GAST|nr:hypothetical protein PoB_004699900 [Plakobranchus ocellatus]